MRVLVAAVGNPLAADDGAGPAVAARLRAAGPLPGVRVVDLHTDVLGLAGVWRGEEEVWLVDALRRGAPPGTVHRLAHRELLEIPQRHAHAHALSLPACLRWLLLAEPALAAVRFRLWGVEPRTVAPGEELSPEVEAAVGTVAEEIAAAARRAAAAG